MKELIKVEERNGNKVVSARELYIGLGLDKSNWSRWSKQNIEEDQFFKENVDWVGFVIKTSSDKNGNETKDYAVSLDFAKHIAMMARTEKSHEYRNYLLECEKVANSHHKVPMTFKEALLLAVEQQEVIEQQKLLLEEQTPKVEFYNAVTGSSDTIDMRVVATTLNMGIGRNRIFEILRDKGVLDRKNIPYQYAIDAGYFRTVESSYSKPDGTNCINIKTVVFQKGLNYIRKVVNESLTNK